MKKLQAKIGKHDKGVSKIDTSRSSEQFAAGISNCSQKDYCGGSLVTTLGPDGTYASQCAGAIFPGEKLRFEPTIADVLDSDGVLVLPLENGIEGTVRLSWDGILERGLQISGIYKLPVHHVLASKGSLSKIEKVVSHPQAIAQCRRFLDKNLKGVKIEYLGSTAEAVKKAKRSAKVAAIASPYACERYELPILKRNIEDEKGNETIFGVIAERDVYPGDEKEEMHIMVTPKKNVPGLLFNILKPFHDYTVDLTRLESRPTRKKLGEYRFLLSFKLDQNVGAVLGILRRKYKVEDLGKSISLN